MNIKDRIKRLEQKRPEPKLNPVHISTKGNRLFIDGQETAEYPNDLNFNAVILDQQTIDDLFNLSGLAETFVEDYLAGYNPHYIDQPYDRMSIEQLKKLVGDE